jgi:hypothetical protein
MTSDTASRPTLRQDRGRTGRRELTAPDHWSQMPLGRLTGYGHDSPEVHILLGLD